MEPSHREFVSLVYVALAAFGVPLLLALIPRQPVPAIVGEVAAGIALGSSGTGWIQVGPAVEFLFLFGLAMLLMLAGFEIDVPALLDSLRKRPGGVSRLRSPLVLAGAGLVIRLAVGFAGAGILAVAGFIDYVPLVAILLTSTSLGIVLTVLHERELTRTAFGQLVITSAAVADIATVLLLSVFFSVEERDVATQLYLVGLVVLAGVALLGGLHVLSRPAWIGRLLDRLSGKTVRIRLRGSLALLLVFVALTGALGIESILGAFIAGLVLTVLSPGERGDALRDDVSMIGFSFFIPAFFVIAGARLDIDALLEHGDDLALVPILLVLVFAAKAGTAPLLRMAGMDWRDAFAGGVLQSAQLTLTIAGVEIGLRLGVISDSFAAALVLVAVCSVLLAPLGFAALLRPGPKPAGREG